MHSVKSAFHDIELIHYGVVEPNNGRMLWEVDLKINGQLVTKEYFGDWPYTTIGNRYAAESPDGRFFFVSSEGGGFVLDAQRNFKVLGITYRGLSAATFQGNLYDGDWLIIVHRNEVIMFNLLTGKQHSLDFPQVRVHWVSPLNDQQLRIIYSDPGSFRRKSMVVNSK
ncbi:MAG: hypothetical protein EOO63_11940 [Hymenobacter sp.]|nr:MAG: hypothetical protein EOO63_11940 [Hymenobacter sp.]